MYEKACLACYACFQPQLEAGKALFRGLRRAKMTENVILGVSQAESSGHMLMKVVPNTKGHRFNACLGVRRGFPGSIRVFSAPTGGGKSTVQRPL